MRLSVRPMIRLVVITSVNVFSSFVFVGPAPQLLLSAPSIFPVGKRSIAVEVSLVISAHAAKLTCTAPCGVLFSWHAHVRRVMAGDDARGVAQGHAPLVLMQPTPGLLGGAPGLFPVAECSITVVGLLMSMDFAAKLNNLVTFMSTAVEADDPVSRNALVMCRESGVGHVNFATWVPHPSRAALLLVLAAPPFLLCIPYAFPCLGMLVAIKPLEAWLATPTLVLAAPHLLRRAPELLEVV
mmetsp:Transcript_48931/g.114253  ORF Transcript_48931/g.114253 Transcript_48931/m.114253 type:complete len:240 (-) Transcript_48931:540-1259(-)